MRKVIHSIKAPKAIGPYSQAISYENLIFTSGQIPINPISGNMITGDIKAEILQILKNISFILEEGGSSLKDVVKYTVYLTDLSLFSDVNKIFEEIYIKDPPARSTIQVSALPKSARVEIEAISCIKHV